MSQQQAEKLMERMPHAKVVEAVACAKIENRECKHCGVKTYFVGMYGNNSPSDCHSCGETTWIQG